MCKETDLDNILLEIENPYIEPHKKLIYGILSLKKAIGFTKKTETSEVSPYKSVRELILESALTVHKGLSELYNDIVRTWLGLEKANDNVFVLNKRIFLNPKTGKPLTAREWSLIKKDILRRFSYIYKNEDERIASYALALGKILKGLSLDLAIDMGYSKLKDQIPQTLKLMRNPRWKNTVNFAQQHAGELIVEVKQRQLKKIHDTLVHAIKNRLDSRELSTLLYEKFGEMNRDWVRIARTEIGTSVNNGILLEELETSKEGEPVFVRGISSPNACPFCRSYVNGKIFVLLENPLKSNSDQVTIKGKTYTAIWPGKDNYGRSRKNWWVASGTQHPHCLCTFVRYIPGFEKWDQKIRTALDEALKRNKEKLPEDIETTIKPAPWIKEQYS